jgi:hypothetical protein
MTRGRAMWQSRHHELQTKSISQGYHTTPPLADAGFASRQVAGGFPSPPLRSRLPAFRLLAGRRRDHLFFK